MPRPLPLLALPLILALAGPAPLAADTAPKDGTVAATPAPAKAKAKAKPKKKAKTQAKAVLPAKKLVDAFLDEVRVALKSGDAANLMALGYFEDGADGPLKDLPNLFALEVKECGAEDCEVSVKASDKYKKAPPMTAPAFGTLKIQKSNGYTGYPVALKDGKIVIVTLKK